MKPVNKQEFFYVVFALLFLLLFGSLTFFSFAPELEKEKFLFILDEKSSQNGVGTEILIPREIVVRPHSLRSDVLMKVQSVRSTEGFETAGKGAETERSVFQGLLSGLINLRNFPLGFLQNEKFATFPNQTDWRISRIFPAKFLNKFIVRGGTERLIIEDLIIGTGQEVASGKRLAINYVGRLQDGTVFDSSWARGRAFEFTLGAEPRQVLEGWEMGLAGMKVGGRRFLIVPPSLGYGDAGQGLLIPPGATLYYEIELLAVD